MKTLLALLLGCCVSLTSLNAAETTDTAPVVGGNTALATDFYAKLKNEEGNLFFSPYSISTALAMTFAGARGDTAQQMAEVLHFTVPQDRLNPAFAELEAELEAIQKKGKVQLSVANSLWPQKGYPFLPEYVRLLKRYYGSTVTPLDFAKNPEAARKTINDWVERETNRKITDLIKPGVLDSLTRLVLANAVYFKGKWANQFDSKQTQDGQFLVTSNSYVKCKMMHRKATYAFAEMPDLKVLELPYAGDDVSMIVLLPQKMDGIGALENELTAAKLTEWTKLLRQQEVEIALPKFKLTCAFSLKRTLTAMGMTDAFSEKADFSGMDGRKNWLYLSAVLHKAFVDVNEEGTEAAAATAEFVEVGAELVPPTFIADHPFLFLIRDRHTGSILFLGRVINPTAYPLRD
jgi:serpin B